MAYLNNEYLTTLIQLTTAGFSTLSAFLVAGYLAAHRLTRFMVSFVVIAFVWWSFTISLAFYRLTTDFFGLRHEMHVAATGGKGLAWHSAAQIDGGVYSPIVFSVIWLTLNLCAIYFFFHCRRMNRKVETPVTVQPAASTSP